MNIPALTLFYGGYKVMGILQDRRVVNWAIPIEEVGADKLNRMRNDLGSCKEEYVTILNAYKIQL